MPLIRRTGATGFLGSLFFRLVTTSVLAQDGNVGHVVQLDELQPYEQEIAAECRKLAMQETDGYVLEGKPLNETNAMNYVPGEEFDLHLAFLGHGNTFFTVSCQVDQEGYVIFEDIDETGMPSTGTI